MDSLTKGGGVVSFLHLPGLCYYKYKCHWQTKKIFKLNFKTQVLHPRHIILFWQPFGAAIVRVVFSSSLIIQLSSKTHVNIHHMEAPLLRREQ